MAFMEEVKTCSKKLAANYYQGIRGEHYSLLQHDDLGHDVINARAISTAVLTITR